jgi:hypothetical protein
MNCKLIAENWLRSLAWIVPHRAPANEMSDNDNDAADPPRVRNLDDRHGGGDDNGPCLAT